MNVDYELIKKIIGEVVSDALAKRDTTKCVYNNKEMMALLGVSRDTLKKYRDEGMLGFSQVGDKYFYSDADVQLFLDKSHYEPFYWS